jgi:hypothetical protein
MSLLSAPQLLRASPAWPTCWQTVHASLVKPIELVRSIQERCYETWRRANNIERIFPDERTDKNKRDLARLTQILTKVAERARHGEERSGGTPDVYQTLHVPWLSIRSLQAIREEAISVDDEVSETLKKLHGVAHKTWIAGQEIRSHAHLVYHQLISDFGLRAPYPYYQSHLSREIRKDLLKECSGFTKQIPLLERLLQAMTEERSIFPLPAEPRQSWVVFGASQGQILTAENDLSLPSSDDVQADIIPPNKNTVPIDRNQPDNSKKRIPVKSRRSTQKGEAREKLIAALTEHHKYDDGSCLNLEPIGNNTLARAAGVSTSTASDFFEKEFGDHGKYTVCCRDTQQLIFALKLLRSEFSPHLLYGSAPPGEREKDDQ